MLQFDHQATGYHFFLTLKIPFIFDHWNGDLTHCLMFQSWRSYISSEALSNLVFLQCVIFFKAAFCLFVFNCWCSCSARPTVQLHVQTSPHLCKTDSTNFFRIQWRRYGKKKSLIVDVIALNE